MSFKLRRAAAGDKKAVLDLQVIAFKNNKQEITTYGTRSTFTNDYRGNRELAFEDAIKDQKSGKAKTLICIDTTKSDKVVAYIHWIFTGDSQGAYISM